MIMIVVINDVFDFVFVCDFDVCIFGEDVGVMGGVFCVIDGL